MNTTHLDRRTVRKPMGPITLALALTIIFFYVVGLALAVLTLFWRNTAYLEVDLGILITSLLAVTYTEKRGL